MAKVKTTNSSTPKRKIRQPLNPEADEQLCISLAVDLVKERLINGTASSQETTHFLKLATQKYREEVALARAQKEKAEAQVEAMKSQKRIEGLYEEAIKAFRNYNGQGDPDEYTDY